MSGLDFLERLVRFESALWALVERELVAAGEVGPGTLLALRVIARREGAARVQELAHELAVTIGAASKLADRLERDGLAVRRPHPSDRRSSLIALTDTGEAAINSAAEVVEDLVARRVQNLNELLPASSAVATLSEQMFPWGPVPAAVVPPTPR